MGSVKCGEDCVGAGFGRCGVGGAAQALGRVRQQCTGGLCRGTGHSWVGGPVNLHPHLLSSSPLQAVALSRPDRSPCSLLPCCRGVLAGRSSL